MHPELVPTGSLIEDPALQSKLEVYAALVAKWSPSINLVSRDSLRDLWSRHFVDSLQLLDVMQAEPRRWFDMGSGGGFPGAVVAIAAHVRGWKTEFILAESDQRKATFLRTVSRETGVGFDVRAERIEQIPPQAADVVSARALAPLIDLCGYAVRHSEEDGLAIFPKGQGAEREIEQARRLWSFQITTQPSQTDPSAKLLLLKGLRRA